MITIHKWTCKKCYLQGKAQWRWFLAVDDSIDFDKQRLYKFETAVSHHIFNHNGHEVIHKQKEEGKIKYV